MTFVSGPFNGLDRMWKAEDFTSYFASFIGNGVFPDPSTTLQVVEHDEMKTIIKPGKCWINGYYGWNKNDYVLQHDIADGVLKRIDRIVLRWDIEERRILPHLKKGAYGNVPVAPALQRNADVYELALADVFIDAGATEITQSNITDTRLNNELCGLMHNPVYQVDTTDLYNQYLDFWNNWRTGKMDEFEQFLIDSQSDFDEQTAMNQQEFDEWFSTIHDILDEDAAGNLLQMIEDIIDSKGQPGGIAKQNDFQDFKDLRGEPNGLATLGEDGRVVPEQLGNMYEVVSRLGYDIYAILLEQYYLGNSVDSPSIDNVKSIFFDGFKDSHLIGGETTALMNEEGVICSSVESSEYPQSGSFRSFTTDGKNYPSTNQYRVGSPSGVLNGNYGDYVGLDREDNRFELPRDSRLGIRYTLSSEKAIKGIQAKVGVGDGDSSNRVNFLYELNGESVSFRDTGSYSSFGEMDFAEAGRSRYIYVAIQSNTSTGVSGHPSYIHLVEFKVLTKSYRTSELYSLKRNLDFETKGARLFISVKEPTGTSTLPTILFDGVESVGEVISSRPDPTLAGFTEYEYKFTGVGNTVQLKTILTPNNPGSSTPTIGRYGVYCM